MLKEIHKLTKRDEATVREWFRKSGGRAFVLVHPFYGPHPLDALPEPDPFKMQPSEYEACDKKIAEAQEKLRVDREMEKNILFPYIRFDLCKPGEPVPVFLFEEKHEIPETLKRIEEERREVKETQKLVRATLNEKWRFIPWRIIIVPTKKGEPLPAHEDWNSVTERMRRLGAENLLVCGKFLEKFDRRQRPTEAALNALMDEHPALATALKETSAPFLRDDKAVAALQRQAYEKSFNKFARRAAKKGVGEEMLKKMKNVLLEKTNFGVGRCVGEAYNKLLLSNRFKKVRVHERYCR